MSDNLSHSTLDVLNCSSTRDLAPFPLDKSAIGSRWVYKIKIKLDGLVEGYKAQIQFMI